MLLFDSSIAFFIYFFSILLNSFSKSKLLFILKLSTLHISILLLLLQIIKSLSVRILLSEIIHILSIIFLSSLTFPGQLYFSASLTKDLEALITLLNFLKVELQLEKRLVYNINPS
jgi:hypothetical protein